MFSATKKAAQGIAGLTAGVLAMGAATAAQFQSTTLDIQSFTGDTAKQASGVTKSLYAMSNPVGMKNVTANYEHLMTAGFDQDKSLRLMRSITDISATKQDPAGPAKAGRPRGGRDEHHAAFQHHLHGRPPERQCCGWRGEQGLPRPNEALSANQTARGSGRGR